MPSPGFGLFFLFIYLAGLAGVVIAIVMVIRALDRIADAQESAAVSLDEIARRLEVREQADEKSDL